MPRNVALSLSTTCRYTLAGIAFGVMFPALGIAFDFVIGGHGDSYSQILRSNPIHYIVHLAPLVLGVTFHIMGHKAERVWLQLQQLLEAEERIRHTAYRDALTGLENRRAFTEHMAELLATSETGDRETAVILFDIDKFKFINDTLGHNTGDELIQGIVERARAILPAEVDLYRLGGDEFVAIWPAAPELDAMLATVRRLVERCAEAFALTEASVSVGISVGVSWLDADDTNETQALGRADLALYHAKNASGSGFAIFDISMAKSAAHRVHVQRELKQALIDDQLGIAYQPIMHADGRTVAGLEALIRWHHPVRGLVMPDLFIDVAEQSGLIIEIGKHVLEQACREAMSWTAAVSVSVNLSPVQFKDRFLVETVLDTLDRTGLPGNRLVLEMTESVFQIDPKLVRETLDGLRELGIRIALDDFGSGFSGINHLRQFTVDILKIDRQYTQAMIAGGRENMLVQTIVALSKALDLEITFEGIETREQLETAAGMGASFVQGYYISRPLLAEAAAVFVTRHQGRKELAMAL